MVFLFLYSFFIHSEIVHETTKGHLQSFSYQDFCNENKAKSDMLASVVSRDEIECFNEKFKISDFCLKKMNPDSPLIRYYGLDSEKKVYCEDAKSVRLQLDCGQLNTSCRDPKDDCGKLKKIYAYSLDLAHGYRVDDKLHCLFSKTEVENDHL